MKLFAKDKIFYPAFNGNKDLPENERLAVTLKVLSRRDFLHLSRFNEKDILDNLEEYLKWEKEALKKYVSIKNGDQEIETAEFSSDSRYSDLIDEIVQELVTFSTVSIKEKKISKEASE